MRAVFFDKDGTLLVNVPYNADPALVELSPKAPEALRALSNAGFALFIVTNQAGIALARFQETEIKRVEKKIGTLLAPYGVRLSGFYYCPHHPDGIVPDLALECECRKPRPGLLQRAAREHRVSLDQSWLIGNILDDVEAGRAAGCRTILLENGNETEWWMSPSRAPDLIARDLLEAANHILGGHGHV